MGRPIKKKYFGNTNTGSANTRADDGIGGEGVATVAISNSGTLYSAGSVPVFTAPQIVGGVRATGALVLNSAGSVASINITDVGSGYTSAPTVSITKATTTSSTVTGAYTATTLTATSVASIYVGMVISGGLTGPNGRVQSITGPVAGVYTINTDVKNNGTFTNTVTFTDGGASFSAGTISLTNSQQNAILFTSWVPTASNGSSNTGGSAITGGDIVKQTGSKRYYVKTTQGYGVCTLTTGTVTRGKIEMTATDWYGNIYNVARLQQRKLTVWRKTQNGASPWVYLNGDVAGWVRAAGATGTNRLLTTTHVQLVTG
jgi:hypothetical protein